MQLTFAMDLAELSLFVLCAYALLITVARYRRPHWAQPLKNRRLAVVALLTFAVGAIKLTEDVVGKQTGPIDTAVLWLIRDHLPLALHGFFAAVTLTGSALFLVPAAFASTVALFVSRRRFEAALMAATTLTALVVVWSMKAIVGRARPTLWESQWYAGSSFPSGHTLSTAAFSTAAALCVARICPRAATPAMLLAVLWTSGVAMSRLVLGVHWPSDVLVAMCLGAFIALSISVAHDLRHRQVPRA